MNRTDRNVIGWGFILSGIGFLMVSADIRHLIKRLDNLEDTVNHNVDTANGNMKSLKRYLSGLEKRIDKKGE